MSCDFGVWFPYERLSSTEALQLYSRLCDGESSLARPHPAVEAFYNELVAKYPEIDTVEDDRIDDHDYCPWSCALDYSPGHVIMACVWSKADYVGELVHSLARKHGLAVYDPQSERITYPDVDSTSKKRPWWRICPRAPH